ncbi:hypothetical protein [Actinocrispum sp. NPDC049592]|uniref:hypothetical protein n=1 Tax=Actinocrispum sp. NPDC049592 TaxID=3154835 RepID=UPI00344296CC
MRFVVAGLFALLADLLKPLGAVGGVAGLLLFLLTYLLIALLLNATRKFLKFVWRQACQKVFRRRFCNKAETMFKAIKKIVWWVWRKGWF